MAASQDFARPHAVVQAAAHLIASGELAHHLGVSAQRAVLGLLLGGTIGFTLGLLTGMFALAEGLLDSSVQMIRTIPTLAMIPLVILWFGIGEEAKIFLIALGVFFPLYLNTFHGVRSVDAGLKEMGRVYGLRGWGLFREVIFPGALPYILIGVRFALGTMWLTLIAAEALAAEFGHRVHDDNGAGVHADRHRCGRYAAVRLPGQIRGRRNAGIGAPPAALERGVSAVNGQTL